LPLGRLHETEIASDRCLALPFFSNLKTEQIEYVAETLREAVVSECGAAEIPTVTQNPFCETESTLREQV